MNFFLMISIEFRVTVNSVFFGQLKNRPHYFCRAMRIAVVRFFRSTLYTAVRLGIRDLRVKSAVRQKRQYALFAAIRIKPNYA